IAVAGLAIAGFGIFMIIQAVSRNESVRSGVVITAVGVLIAAVFFVIGSGVVEIQPNEVGVVFNVLSGNLAATPLGPGLHIIIPGVQEVTIYSTSQQEYTMSGAVGEGAVRGDDAVVALTQDGQQVKIDVTIIYRIDPANVNTVHRKWQNRYQDSLIRPALRNQVRAALTLFRVEQIYGAQHADLEQKIEEGTRQIIEPEGFQVTNVLIRNIAFSTEYVASIEQKQVAQQEAEEAKFRVQQRQQEAEQTRELARGDADAVEIRAQGEAEALRLINEQLKQNSALIQWRYIEQLGDNVRIIVIPSNSPYLFDLQSLTQQASSDEVITPTPTAEPDQSGGGS
ncbi:MAG TPA: prohibitin family protein, partial [Aggregatilineaceae bacterium]|nr:prohibitin family protein [Aggregatilineaceae bacterium]